MMEGDHLVYGEELYVEVAEIAAAYDLNPVEISGGPEWVGSEHFDIVALTPGDVRPTRMEQMSNAARAFDGEVQACVSSGG